MLAVLIGAVIAWVSILSWRRAQFLSLTRHFREQAARYAQAVSQHVHAVAQVANLERELASSGPPAAGSDYYDVMEPARSEHCRIVLTETKQGRDNFRLAC
jgi:hypothetical protein